PDGVVFVSLDAVRDPELLPAEVLAALGMRETETGGPEERLVEVLRARKMLLILDNFEGLLAGVPFVSRLLAAAPGVKVLVTSRQMLRARGEIAFPVPPMELPPRGTRLTLEEAMAHDAVRLFVDRADDVSHGFVLDEENVEAVVEVCRRVDGLPLSIELVAARVRTLPRAALLERMTKRLPVLTGGPRTPPSVSRPCAPRSRGATTSSASATGGSSRAWRSSSASPTSTPSRASSGAATSWTASP